MKGYITYQHIFIKVNKLLMLLLTGMVPTHIVRVNVFLASQSGLPKNETTIAKLAQSAGYKTAIIGTCRKILLGQKVM